MRLKHVNTGGVHEAFVVLLSQIQIKLIIKDTV
jgi:hypothetical protein